MSAENVRISLDLPATHILGTHIVGLLEAVCSEIVLSHKLSNSFTFQVISAFQEAYNNIIVHAYLGQEGSPVRVNVTTDARSITITLEDAGQPIEHQNPIVELLDFGAMAPDALPEGGMGMSIMHSCMELVRYGREAGHNQVKMTKFFSCSAP